MWSGRSQSPIHPIFATPLMQSIFDAKAATGVARISLLTRSLEPQGRVIDM